MSTGRYYVMAKDPTGKVRKFCVEPVDERVNRSKDWGWYEGLQAPKGGAVKPEDSVITPENGYTHIVTLAPGVSPEDWIAHRLELLPAE